jgi:hypothetical protein
MARYDLRDANNFAWVLFQRWFSLGLRVFVVLMGIAIAYDGYHVIAIRAPIIQFVALGFLLWVWSLFAWISFRFRPPASYLTIDESGMRLDYNRGSPDIRSWRDARLRIRGRRTDGVKDSISRGKPLQSVFGPRGGYQESFLPRAALDELFQEAKRHGLGVSERFSRPGWTVYIISR